MEDLRRFYVRDLEAWNKTLSCGKFSDKALEVKVVERGIILPARKIDKVLKGGVCDKDFNFVAGFTRKDPDKKGKGGGFFTVESSYVVDKSELVELDEDVIFGGALYGHIGHFFIECLSRLWYVIKHPDLKLKILFFFPTIIKDRKYHSWFDEFFRLMGIDLERIIYVNKPTQFRSITVPEQSQYNSWNSVKYTKEFFIPYQAIESRVKPGTTKKVYFTRTKLDSHNPEMFRRCFNEKYFDDFFATRGFEIIAPEELSIEEKISLMMGADEFAARTGTSVHYSMFCKPGTKVIALNNTESTYESGVNSYSFQMFVNKAFNIDDYYVVDVSKSVMPARKMVDGVFLIGSTKHWKNFVADYFGEQISKEDDISYLEESLDDYVNFWCEKYKDQKNLPVWTEALSEVCHRIVALEREIGRNRPLLSYQTRIQKKGWGLWRSENQFSNFLDQQTGILAIRLDFPLHSVYYSVYSNEQEGWSKEVTNNQQAVLIGKSKLVTGIKIRLDEAGAKDFDILYRIHKLDGEWTSWAKNGEELLSGGTQINAIQIKLQTKN